MSAEPELGATAQAQATARAMAAVRVLQLTDDEIQLLISALDSHEYWQLSESNERNDG